jgi:2-polyprenyl-3-methyl-5-hydroxy-6-metoxy-1,4-benzoquinol methylase
MMGSFEKIEVSGSWRLPGRSRTRIHERSKRVPNYGEIYDDIIKRQENYNRAENSPGYQSCVQASDALSLLEGNVLDVGCGVGFVLEYLAGAQFHFNVWGVDASAVAVERAQQRIARDRHLPPDRVQQIKNQRLQFQDNFFSLVTCFDMLEHLDEPDIDAALLDMFRVLRHGGAFFCSVSCRLAGTRDLHGDNLHRTVNSVDWWLARVKPDRAVYDSSKSQLTFWKQVRKLGN